jgi:chromosome segregation ATPase
MSQISREKYDRVKAKVQSWYDKAVEYEGDIEHLTYENEQLKQSLKIAQEKLQQNNNYVTENEQLKKSLHTLKIALEKLQKNNTTTNDFTKQNQKLDHTIQELTVKINKMEHEKMTNEISHQKQILQKDNQIERYKTSLEDLRERYNEMKEHNKELRKNK